MTIATICFLKESNLDLKKADDLRNKSLAEDLFCSSCISLIDDVCSPISDGCSCSCSCSSIVDDSGEGSFCKISKCQITKIG